MILSFLYALQFIFTFAHRGSRKLESVGVDSLMSPQPHLTVPIQLYSRMPAHSALILVNVKCYSHADIAGDMSMSMKTKKGRAAKPESIPWLSALCVIPGIHQAKVD